MGFLAGEKVTAGRLNRLQPVPYVATASAALNGPQTSTAITGASIPLTTFTNGAICLATAFFDFDNSGATTAVGTGELFLDGVKQFTEAVYQQGISTDRLTPGQEWLLTIPTAGAHTFDLRASLPTGVQVHETNTRLVVEVFEVV